MLESLQTEPVSISDVGTIQSTFVGPVEGSHKGAPSDGMATALFMLKIAIQDCGSASLKVPFEDVCICVDGGF